MKVRELITALEKTGQPDYEIVVGDGESIYSLTGLGDTSDAEEEVTIEVERAAGARPNTASGVTGADGEINPNDSFEPSVSRRDS
jgi:hypothetical protein